MAKFRRSHSQKKESGGMIARMGIFGLIVAGLWLGFQKFTGMTSGETEEPVSEDVENIEEYAVDSIFFLPTSTTGQIVQHKYYALSYVEEFEVPEWVAFELTSERLNMPWVSRTNNFRPDPKVETKSASPDDYRHTKYDRGHLCAAADMAFSRESMSETFYMSNMTPQRPGFNKGIWRELEELNRNWAKRFKHLYVITGPVLSEKVKFWIGPNQVAVPEAFYRVILDIREPEKKGIAFIIPNEVTEERLDGFATSIDEVEEITGIDFFHELLAPDLEEKLESEYDIELWKMDERKYRKRVDNWNNQGR